MIKVGVALIAAIAVSFGGVLALPAQAAEPIGVSASPPDSELLLHYDFADVTGTTVVDSSSHGNDGVLRGTGSTLTDGALALPGGAASSTAAYVQLPTGLFDGRDAVTISTWMRGEGTAANTAAMFFGTTQSTPAQYWLLNPRNPSNQVKSVITNGSTPASPWNTESGIAPTVASRGVAGPAATNSWALYTTVIEPTQLTLYVNGVSAGTVPVARTVSQFGTGLVSYIGKSSYPDALWKGSVRDLAVYSTALTATQVSALYLTGQGDTAVIDAALTADADAISLGNTQQVVADLQLPTSGTRGSTIAWKSSAPTVVSAAGTVTRPTTSNTSVVLTATLQLAGRTLVREFPLTVLANNPQNNLSVIVDPFSLGITHITDDIVLPTSVGAASVVWTSSTPTVISTSGSVTRSDAATPVTLTAVFTLNGVSATREFTVTVLAKDGGRIGSYILSGNTARTDVLHLATSADGDTYAAINNGRGVLYPTLGATKFTAPTLVRAPDGTFRLIAGQDGTGSRLYVYDSADLTSFTNERLVTFNSAGLTAATLSASYDNGIGAYRLYFTAVENGAGYEVTTTDFVTFTAPVGATAPADAEDGTFPTGALDTSSIGVTAAEYAAISTKFGRVTSTGVRAFDDIHLDEGEDATLPPTATVEYTSGDTTTMSVEWDAADVAALADAEPGTYEVSGTVERKTYSNPLVERRADPDVTLGDDGWYYFTASYPMTSASDPTGYDRVVLRRAQTIQGLSTAPETTIWHENTDPVLNRYIWAPELTKIGDDWYIMFTASRSGVWDIRPAMLKFTGGEFTGDATLDAANWTSIGQVKAAAGDTTAFTNFSLDMTYFEAEGHHYLVWAEKPAIGSTLRMGEIDPAAPNQLLSPSILLSAPTFAWEKNGGDSIDEGPAVIQRDGKVIVAFSAATVDDKYCVGVLTADSVADLMNPASWTKNPYPLLTSADVPGQVGPGHNSFTVDELGNPVIVYHSRTVGDTSNPGEATDAGLYDPRRHARAATVHFSADGLPVLAMTAAEELSPAQSAVTVRVIVADDTPPVVPQVSATLSTPAADGANGWYITSPSVALSVQDGVTAQIEYRLDDGAWVQYTAPITVADDGAHTVEYRASVGGSPVDASDGSLVVNLDRVLPTATAVLSQANGEGTPEAPVTLTLSAADSTSGLDRIEYRTALGEWTAYAQPLTFSEIGAQNIWYRAFDRAGQASAEGIASIVIAEAGTAAGVLSTDTTQVTPGVPFTVNGSGFGPNERVDLMLFSDPVFLGFATTDASGAFSVEVTAPLSTPAGAHTLRATGAVSAIIGTLSLTVRALPAAAGPDTGGNTGGNTGVAGGSGTAAGSGTGSVNNNGLLSETGFSGWMPVLPVGLAMVLAGLVVMVVRRRSRSA